MLRRKYGSANVEEHPKGSGRWRVRAKIGGKLETIVSGLEEKEAVAAADAYAEHRDADSLRAGLTLTQFGPTVMERRKRRGGRSVDKDRNRWQCYVEADALGGIPLRALRRSDVVEWRDRLHSRLSGQTVRNALNLLRSALTDALDRELVTENVARDVRVPRRMDVTTEEDLSGVLLPDEQGRVLASAPDGPYRRLVTVALYTGLRWSELSYLRREDVQGDVLVVRRSVGGGPTKGGRARRVPLLPPSQQAIREQLATLPKACPWVFPGTEGTPRKFRPSRWTRWVEAAGITRRVRWHDLRHTCGTSLLAGWWSSDGHRWALDEVCAMLGHRSQTTTEIYARKVDETLMNAASRMVWEKFPEGNGTKRKGAKILAYQRLPKPWVTRSNRVGGATEKQPDSRSAGLAAGNFPGTRLERAQARLEAVEASGSATPHDTAGLAVLRVVGVAYGQDPDEIAEALEAAAEAVEAAGGSR